MPAFSGISHISFSVRDAEASASWWASLLELTEIDRSSATGGAEFCSCLGEVDDVVDAILYLENAGFVTGEILHVDGGQSAGH